MSKVILLRFLKVRHKIPLITKLNKSAMTGAQFMSIEIPRQMTMILMYVSSQTIPGSAIEDDDMKNKK